ncbi:hypothetical protein QBC34DRAFT_436932 [Podospora aff. communis PSN243]|uniref:Uncharacterized protein n=1 Tax=Podospora aff. communis PSN243 TaxID=3040156 RepID=A0AAV9GSH1_9PEZI|nr:hypothetical protein QBC34DRAFT_436932 [Podospora aff. communis PSN243]
MKNAVWGVSSICTPRQCFFSLPLWKFCVPPRGSGPRFRVATKISHSKHANPTRPLLAMDRTDTDLRAHRAGSNGAQTILKKLKEKLTNLGMRFPTGDLFPIESLKTTLVDAIARSPVSNLSLSLTEAQLHDSLIELFEACHQFRSMLFCLDRMSEGFWSQVRAQVQWARAMTSQEIMYVVLALTNAAWAHLQDPVTNGRGEIIAPTRLSFVAIRFAGDLDVYEGH